MGCGWVQGSCLGMLALGFGGLVGNPRDGVVSTFFVGVKMGKNGWQACLILIPPAMGLRVSHFEANQAHPRSPAVYYILKILVNHS